MRVQLRTRFNCRELSFVSVNKDSHLLEVPEALASRLGGEFHLCGNRKGYKRWAAALRGRRRGAEAGGGVGAGVGAGLGAGGGGVG